MYNLFYNKRLHFLFLSKSNLFSGIELLRFLNLLSWFLALVSWYRIAKQKLNHKTIIFQSLRKYNKIG